MFQASFHVSPKDLRKLLRGKKSVKKNTSKQPMQREPKKSPSSRLPRPVPSETPCKRKPKKLTAVTAAVSSPSFSKCAKIAAHYAISDVLDNLIISLTKFNMLVSTTETAENFKIMYGPNNKALLATRAVFSLTQYRDILREGWKNLTECLPKLFKCQLLPTMMEGGDYVETGGRVYLFRDELPRETENSLVSFIVASSEVPREFNQEEENHLENARKTVAECHPEHLFQDSKLLTESLKELVKYLTAGSVMDNTDTKDMAMTTRITVANTDRVGAIWRGVCNHLHRMISASARTLDMQFHLERAVSSLQFFILMTKLNSKNLKMPHFMNPPHP